MAQNDQAFLIRPQESGLDFVVIGEGCVVFHGAPLAAFALDVCCPSAQENVRRIESAMDGLHPVRRLTANELPLEMTRSAFGDLKSAQLQIDLGKPDSVGEVAGIGNFDEVLKRSIIAKLSYGAFRFLSLDALIEAKQFVGRDRDLADVRHHRAIEEKLERQPNPKSET